MKKGKISGTILKRSVIKLIDVKNERVICGSGIAADCCAIEPDERYILTSTQSAPYGGRLAPYYAVIKAVNNIAACGGTPISASAAFILPESMEERELKALTRMVLCGCRECNAELAGGHTCVSDKVSEPVVSVTVTGVCKTRDYIDVKKVEPGMDIIVTDWIGLEKTAFLLDMYEDELLRHFPSEYVLGARSCAVYVEENGVLYKMYGTGNILKEAAIAAENGAVAMHDVSEGGVFAALWELAEGAGTGITVDIKAIPIRQETVEFCEVFDINPYQAESAGCLLIVTDNGEDMVRRLLAEGINAAVIGYTTDTNDKIILNGDETRYLDKP